MRSKIIALTVMAAAFAFAFSAHAEAYVPMAGDIIKTTSSPEIYVIDDNLARHSFSTQSTYWTWFSGSWATQNIKIISQADFDNLNVGKSVIARAGAKLIKFSNSGKIYALQPGGIICEVRALYPDWKNRVITIQSGFESNYVRDNSCVITSDSKYPDGTLIKYAATKTSNTSDIYLIDGGKKRKISAEAFAKNNYQQSSIISDVSPTMVYTAGTAITDVEYKLGLLYSLNYSRSQDILARPDLIISDIIFPSTKVLSAQATEISLVLKNIGGPLTSELGLRNNVFNGQDWQTETITHDGYPTAAKPLLTGQTFTIKYTGRFIAAGTKNFTAKVNEPSEIIELNTANNAFSKKITVYAK